MSGERTKGLGKEASVFALKVALLWAASLVAYALPGHTPWLLADLMWACCTTLTALFAVWCCLAAVLVYHSARVGEPGTNE